MLRRCLAYKSLGRCLGTNKSLDRCVGTYQPLGLQEKMDSNMLLSIDTLLTGADLCVCITPQWSDDCSIHHSSRRGPVLETKKFDETGWYLGLANDEIDDVVPSAKESTTGAQDQLDIHLPERCNLRLHVTGDGFCSVNIRNKLEGDIDITLDNGDISVNKIRGPNLNLHSPRGRVQVLTVAEGALRVTALELQAKTLQGPTLQINTDDDIHVRAAYSTGEIRASSRSGSVELGTVHVSALHSSAVGDVRVDALKGDATLTSARGDIQVHFDSQGPRGESSLSALKGSIEASVQLFAQADIDFSAQRISLPPPSVGHVTFEGLQRLSESGGSTMKGRYCAHASADQAAARSSGKISYEGRQAAASLAARHDSDGMHLPPAQHLSLRADAHEGEIQLRIGSWIETMRRKLKF